MAIGLFAVMAAISSQIAVINKDRENIIATLAAQEKIEDIRGMSFADILDSNKLTPTFTATGPNDANKVPGLSYLNNASGTVVVDNTYSPVSGAADIRRVSVTVSWLSSTGSVLQKEQATLVTRSGINKQ